MTKNNIRNPNSIIAHEINQGFQLQVFYFHATFTGSLPMSIKRDEKLTGTISKLLGIISTLSSF